MSSSKHSHWFYCFSQNQYQLLEGQTSKLLCPYIVAAKWVFKCYSCKNTQSLFSGMERRCWERCGCVWDKMRFPASCPGFTGSLCCEGTRGASPYEKKTRPTCSCMQALERMRRSSLRQQDITLAMAAGLVAYFTCGATRQGEHIPQKM